MADEQNNNEYATEQLLDRNSFDEGYKQNSNNDTAFDQ